MYKERIDYYNELEQEYGCKLLVYVTSDRPNMEAQIASDVIDLFIEHLDRIGVQEDIALYLYTRGGNTSAAWNIVNLLRMYCDKLRVIVPHKAHSAGTIISLGANEIVMTKQATLSPIDPSINTPLNPKLPGMQSTYPISVEAVKGYIELIKDELEISNDEAIVKAFVKLAESVHPLVLGQANRSRAQIQMLAKKLLKNQVTDEDQIKKIIDFLCSDSGSHDYTINRREAEGDLKLKVKKPTEKQYRIIKDIYDDISKELQFGQPFKLEAINGPYIAKRGLIESIVGGSDYFVTEGQCSRVVDQNGQNILQNSISFEGWKHENISDSSHIVVNRLDEGGAVYEKGTEYSL